MKRRNNTIGWKIIGALIVVICLVVIFGRGIDSSFLTKGRVLPASINGVEKNVEIIGRQDQSEFRPGDEAEVTLRIPGRGTSQQAGSPADVVLMLDLSGSMKKKNRIQKAVQALRQYIQNIPTNTEVRSRLGIVFFGARLNTNNGPNLPEIEVVKNVNEHHINLQTIDGQVVKDEIIGSIEAYTNHMDQGTPIGSGVMGAVRVFKEASRRSNVPRVTVLATDGRTSTGPGTCAPRSWPVEPECPSSFGSSCYLPWRLIPNINPNYHICESSPLGQLFAQGSVIHTVNIIEGFEDFLMNLPRFSQKYFDKWGDEYYGKYWEVTRADNLPRIYEDIFQSIYQNAGEQIVIRETLPAGIDSSEESGEITIRSIRIINNNHTFSATEMDEVRVSRSTDGQNRPSIRMVIPSSLYPPKDEIDPDEVVFEVVFRVKTDGITVPGGWIDFDQNYRGCPDPGILPNPPSWVRYSDFIPGEGWAPREQIPLPYACLNLVGLNKTLSNPSPNGTGETRSALSADLNDPFVVIDNSYLNIKIEYQAPVDGDRLRRLVEKIPSNYFDFGSVNQATVSLEPDGNSEIISGNKISKNAGQNEIRFDLRHLTDQLNWSIDANDFFTIEFRIKAIREGEGIRIDMPGSELRRRPAGGEIIVPLPQAYVWIRPALGPIGDVYSEKNIKRQLAYETFGIDVLGSGRGIDDYFDSVNDNPGGWLLTHYNLKKDGEIYSQEYNLAKEKAVSRLAEIKKEVPANRVRSELRRDSDQTVVLEVDGDLNFNRPVRVNGKKVVIVKQGNLDINRNITYGANDLDSQVAFIMNSNNRSLIRVGPNVDRMVGYYFGELDCSTDDNCRFQTLGSEHLVIQGSIVAPKISLGSRQRKVSFIYDPRGIAGLPGIRQLLDPLAREIIP